MEEIILPNQSHTLACMIRQTLFDNGAVFAACTVPHPLDSNLTVRIETNSSTTPKKCLLLSLNDACSEVEASIRVIHAYKAHVEAEAAST